jgi:hypothetical protein
MRRLDQSPPAGQEKAPADAEAIIVAARRRERRRRLGAGVAVVLAAAAAGLIAAVAGCGGGPPRRPAAASSPLPRPSAASGYTVRTLGLSGSDRYGKITVVAGRIIIYGPASSATRPSAGQSCTSAVVNAATLALTGVTSGSCADPSLQGGQVLPVMTVEPDVPYSRSDAVATVTVRISRVMPGGPGYRLGPVVLAFPQMSAGWPTWVYGGGDLWLYDARARAGSELLRISQATGAVVQRLAMPAITRPILAFDDDGLWLAPAANSTGVAAAVYHVAPGASAAVPVFRLTATQYAAWMIASGHALWLQVSSGGTTGTLWHLAGAGARPVAHLTLSSFGGQSQTAGGASTMAGDATGGLWTVVPAPAGTTQDVIRINPATGAWQTVASLKPGYATPSAVPYVPWQAVTVGGSMFLLDPATDSGTYPYQPEGFSALYRISPAPGR